MKKIKQFNVFVVACLAMMVVSVVNNSSYGQQCNGNTNLLPSNKLINAIGCYDIAALIGTGSIPNPDVIQVDLSKVTLANTYIGTESLTDILWYLLPSGGPPVGYTIYMNYLPLWAPGPLSGLGDEGGIIANINFIDDPPVNVDGVLSGHLSSYKDGQGNVVITATSSVELVVGHQFFVSGGGNTRLYKKTNGSWGNPLGQGQPSYTITTSGEYNYFITDGHSGNPDVQVIFEVIIQSQPPTQYTITASSGSNGTIEPSGNVNVTAGENKSFTFNPNSSYEVDEVKVDGSPVTVSGTSYTFTNVQANHTIEVTFKAIPPTQYIITASSGSNGTIEPSGNVNVTAGENKSFTFNPNSGYEVDEVKVDGSPVTVSGTSYTFTNVQANHTIEVTFKAVQSVSPIPVFDELEEEYAVGSPAVVLKMKGVGSEHLTIFKVNGQASSAFNPVTAGVYTIEASSPDGKLKITRTIKVK